MPTPSGRCPLSAVAAAHALLARDPRNHMARAAAMLLLAEAAGQPAYSDGAGAFVVEHQLNAHTLSLLTAAPGADDDDGNGAAPAPAREAVAASAAAAAATAAAAAASHTRVPDLRACGVWDDAWSTAEGCGEPGSAAVRVTLPAVPDELVPAAEAALRRLGRAVTFREPCTTWEAPEEEWVALPPAGGDGGAAPASASASPLLPPGYNLGPLTPPDAPLLNAHWKYADGAGTEEVIRQCIQRYPTMGVRVEANPADAGAGALVCWIVTRYDGSFGILHTLPGHRGKGLARAAVRALCGTLRAWLPALVAPGTRALASGGQPLPVVTADGVPPGPLRAALAGYVRPYCHIATYNEPSARLFESMGWTCVGRCTWLVSGGMVPRLALRPLLLRAPAAAPGGASLPPLQRDSPTQPQPPAGFCADAPLASATPHAGFAAAVAAGGGELSAAALLAHEPWRVYEDPAELAAADPAALQLLALVNAAYRIEDAFFVDQWRTSLAGLAAAAREGVFFVGHALRLRAGVLGGGADGVGRDASGGGGGDGDGTAAGSDGAWPARTQALPMAALQYGLDVDGPEAYAGPPVTTSLVEVGAGGDGGSGSGGEAVRRPPPSPDDPSSYWKEDPARLLVSVQLRIADDEHADHDHGHGHDGADAAHGVGGDAGAAAAASVAPRPRPRVVHLSLLTVAPHLKRSGVAGRALAFALATAARAYDCVAAEVHVVSVKPWLLDWYIRRHGFAQVGTQEWPAPLAHQLRRPCYFHHCRRALVGGREGGGGGGEDGGA